MTKRIAFAALLSLLSLSCASTRAAAPGADTAAIVAAIPRDATFDDMTKRQRGAYMKEVVLPEMRSVFVELDPKLKDMQCRTCHGKGFDDRTFKMPNPDLPVLPASEEGWAKLMQEKGASVRFMATRVKPKMASLLRLPEYDPKTKTGDVGCDTCHVMKAGAATP